MQCDLISTVPRNGRNPNQEAAIAFDGLMKDE